ncbi:MAG TPA: 50S ribosomal protein L25 [Gemmatimonadaceae bacterium]|jgi:large subunit ribosomal protein L25|nr:50S ribosomal protein L25 [Gemmatimonadaceae bacterium]
MATAQLAATPRTGTGKGVARKMRAAGQIPGIIYGHAREPQALAINTRDFEKLLEHISAESTVIELAVGGKTSRTLIREIQRHPFKREYLHVDFQELVAGEMVSVRIPIVLVGIPEGVRLEGGVMDQTLRDLEIEVDPVNMPNHIDVNVENMKIGESVHVSDLTLPAGVTAITEGDTTIVVVSAPRAVIEEAAAPTAEGAEVAPAAEPEVIRAKKTEEETEEK